MDEKTKNINLLHQEGIKAFLTGKTDISDSVENARLLRLIALEQHTARLTLFRRWCALYSDITQQNHLLMQEVDALQDRIAGLETLLIQLCPTPPDKKH